MNIHKRILELLHINEMADICRQSDGEGIIIRIINGDHKPPHTHIIDYQKGKKYKMRIDTPMPNSNSDLIFLGEEPDEKSGIKTTIVKWASKINPRARKYLNWEFLLVQWDIFGNPRY